MGLTAQVHQRANILVEVNVTGKAPFCAFIQHIPEEEWAWKGQVRLLFGAKTDLDLLYMNDVEDDVSRHQLESTLYET